MSALDPILIVDDEKDNLEALYRVLRQNYSVTTVTSAFDALKAVQKNTFHVVVSDQRMPEMTGVELLEKVKTISPNTVRILITGYTDVDSIIDAINRGNIYRYVAKPWDPEDLRLTLRQANEAYLLRRELEEKNQAIQKANSELTRALEDLRLLDRAKARFLQLISHELNTPLTVISSFSQFLMEKKDSLSSDLKKSVSSLKNGTDRLGEIVSEVITYVRLEAENRLHLEKFDFLKEAQVLAETIKDRLAKKGLQCEVVGEMVIVRADPEKMRVAMQKLVEDAMLRSPSGGKIQLEVGTKGDFSYFKVSRSGETLSPEAFTPLEAAAPELHHHQNLGLTLAICRLIVTSHGGKLHLEKSDAKGTTIALLLAK